MCILTVQKRNPDFAKSATCETVPKMPVFAFFATVDNYIKAIRFAPIWNFTQTATYRFVHFWYCSFQKLCSTNFENIEKRKRSAGLNVIANVITYAIKPTSGRLLLVRDILFPCCAITAWGKAWLLFTCYIMLLLITLNPAYHQAHTEKTATPNTTNRIEITANEIAIITSGLKKHMISFLPL